MGRAAKVTVIPTFHPTADTEYQGLLTKDLKALAETGKPAQKKRANAEIERRVKNAPFKAWKKAQKAAARAAAGE